MTIEEVESNIYESLIILNDNNKKNDNKYYNFLDICIYISAFLVFLSIISILVYLAYIYFKDW